MVLKRKLIYSLTLIALILIFINIFINPNQEERLPTSDNLSINEIENIFESVLDRFGIEKSWVDKRKFKNKISDSLSYYYSVKIPTDIPIPLILKELNDEFNNKSTDLKSIEKKEFGSSDVEIKNNNVIKLKAEINYSKELERKFSTAAFLLTDIEKFDEIGLQNFFNIPVKFGVLLPLRSTSIKKAEQILINKLEYFIIIDDDADNVDFELDEDFSISQISRNIKKIITSFNTPKIFFLPAKEEIFSKNFQDFLIGEFQKQKRRLISLDKIPNLKGENPTDLKSLIKFYFNNLRFNENKIFIINADDWLNIQDEINNYLKKGNKIVNPSSVLWDKVEPEKELIFLHYSIEIKIPILK